MSLNASTPVGGTPQFRIERIGPNSPLLPEVFALHAASKSKVGAFPRGAFEEAASRSWILVAIAPDNTAAGYVTYRVAKNRAAVTHLVTGKEFQGQGVARVLMDALKQETQHLAGISLKCRRDYDLGDMWTGFGFTVRHTREGRGRDRALLDCWWYDHGHHDLFSFAAAQDDDSGVLLVGMDANVFYDLVCDNRPQGEDTKVLEADWLEDSIILCVTQEIYNEIHRSPDEAQKARNRGAADGFRLLKTAETTVSKLEVELKPLFSAAILERDLSDLRQVAHAIAAEVPFFVTRDAPMLSRSETIFEKYGLRILHPTDLINHLDTLRRQAEYRPARLEGSQWRERLVTKDDVKQIVAGFKHPHKERANDIERAVRHYLTLPDQWESRLILDGDNKPFVYLVQSKGDPQHIEVPLVRHSDHPLVPTLLRHSFHALNRNLGSVGTCVIRVCDPQASGTTRNALSDLGFFAEGDNWLKFSVTGILTPLDLATKISGSVLPDALKSQLVKAPWFNPETGTEAARQHLEHVFSPVKIISAQTPCFVVSIRPDWAAHFFDIPVGGQTLIDLREELHLGIEGAYYCSAKNTHLQAPGRVLWYVSKGPKQDGSMTVKACSHLEEVVSGTPKQLFARFHHLGVFGWKHVLAAAGGELKNNLIAFRFKRTERFVREVPMSKLDELGIPQPVNPRRISDAHFATIYQIGMHLNQQ
jgi:GNAT superfamily N-acetyltransferase